MNREPDNKCYRKYPKQCFPITNMYLQKLMYYLNVVHLLKTHKPLITDKRFKTWNYGPTIISVHYEYNSYGGSIIPKPVHYIVSIYDRNGNFNPIYYPKNKFPITKKDEVFINHYIWDFNDIDPFVLVNYSHQEPQWKHRKDFRTTYNDFKTVPYYSIPWHQFWKK